MKSLTIGTTLGLALLLVLAPPADAQFSKWKKRLEKAIDVGEKVQDANVHISEEEERSMGRAVAANLIDRFGLVRDEPLTLYVARVGNHLASWSPRPELPWRFAILDTGDINAYACPGGYVRSLRCASRNGCTRRISPAICMLRALSVATASPSTHAGFSLFSGRHRPMGSGTGIV